MRVDCRVFVQDLIFHEFSRTEDHYVILDCHWQDNLRVELKASTSVSLTIWKARNSTGSIPL